MALDAMVCLGMRHSCAGTLRLALAVRIGPQIQFFSSAFHVPLYHPEYTRIDVGNHYSHRGKMVCVTLELFLTGFG